MSRKLGGCWSPRTLSRIGLAALIACTVAACGSSSSKKASGGTSGSQTSTSSASTEVAKAQSQVASFLKAPTSIGTSVKVPHTPPRGKKIIALACQLQVCTAWENEVASIASTLGWTTSKMTFTGTPESILQAMQTAISQKPTAILINGVPRASYTSALGQAISSHVPIVTQMGELQGAVKPPFIAVQYQAKQFAAMSQATARYVIAQSNGKANALVVKYATFPLSIFIANTMASTLTSECSGCKAQELQVQATDTGEALANAIVSKVQADPSINYIMLQDSAMEIGLEPALKAAGLTSRVKVVSNDVTQQSVASIQDGTQQAVMAFSLEAAAYNGIDAVVRHLEGVPVQNVPLANEIFTKSNLGKSPTPSLWNALPPDIGQQYAKLWHTSS